MAETLYITGLIGGERHEVACDETSGTGSTPVLGWIASLNAGVYDYAVLTASLGELPRLFAPGYSTLLYAGALSEAPGPQIDRIAPASIEAGGADVTLHVFGTHFTPRSAILFNGSPESTVFVSTSELTTVVVGATATTPGAYPVSVSTAAPGGGMSAGRTFFVLGPQQKTVTQCTPDGQTCWQEPA